MLTVLIVDDDPDMRLLTRRLVTTLGCQTVEARNGAEAETIALNSQPNLILLDIMMPVQDGYETCQNLRSNHKYDGYVVMMSAMQESAGQRKATECGADAYIQKPMTRDSLRKHLEIANSRQTANYS